MIWLAPTAPPAVEIFRHAKPELVALMLLGVGKAIAGRPVRAFVAGRLRGPDKVVAPYNGEQCSLMRHSPNALMIGAGGRAALEWLLLREPYALKRYGSAFTVSLPHDDCFRLNGETV